MKNKLILFCLLICPLSFASKPLPAAGAGAGAGLPALAAMQADAAAQNQAAQVDVKQLQEQQRKDAAKIARLAAELEALKLQLNKDKEKPQQGYVITWNSKPSGQEEWTEELAITYEDSILCRRVATYYYGNDNSYFVDGRALKKRIIIKDTKCTFGKEVAEGEKISMINTLIDFKIAAILNLLQAAGFSKIIESILMGHANREF